MFAHKRPVEELYDTQTDPWEVHNLAADNRCRDVLDRMREELDVWQKETQNLGLVDERVMKILHYPNRERPVCTEQVAWFSQRTRTERNYHIPLNIPDKEASRLTLAGK